MSKNHLKTPPSRYFSGALSATCVLNSGVYYLRDVFPIFDNKVI